MELYGVNINEKIHRNIYNNFLYNVCNEKVIRNNKLANLESRKMSLIGDILIRIVVSMKEGCSINNIEFEYNEYGKPRLKGIDSLNFNISHSGDFVILAIDNKPIGVDIEKIQNVDSVKIAKRFFTNEEFEWLMNQEEKIVNFYKLWTLKECYIKFLGKGIGEYLKAFSFTINNKKNILLKADNTTNKNNIYFKNFNIGGNYELSVCSHKKITSNEIILYDYTFLNEMLLKLK